MWWIKFYLTLTAGVVTAQLIERAIKYWFGYIWMFDLGVWLGFIQM